MSPQFTELDDRAARLLRAEIVEELADSIAPEAIATVARAYTGEDFTQLMEQVVSRRAGFETPLTMAQARALFDVPAEETGATILADVFLGGEAEWLADLGIANWRQAAPMTLRRRQSWLRSRWISPALPPFPR